MPKWEYRAVHCHLRHLTPGVKWPDLDPAFQQDSGRHWIIQSLHGYVTHLEKGLNEYGDDGWEMVGTTPPLHLPAGSYSHGEDAAFYIFFKRLR